MSVESMVYQWDEAETQPLIQTDPTALLPADQGSHFLCNTCQERIFPGIKSKQKYQQIKMTVLYVVSCKDSGN